VASFLKIYAAQGTGHKDKKKKNTKKGGWVRGSEKRLVNI